MVTITSKQFVQGYGWNIQCIVELNGTRSGTEYVNLPASATDDELKGAILTNYGG
jgi:hypothetical protein